MNNPLVTAILHSLMQIGPEVADAVVAAIRAAHNQPLSEKDHNVLGQAIAQALSSTKVQTQ